MGNGPIIDRAVLHPVSVAIVFGHSIVKSGCFCPSCPASEAFIASESVPRDS